MIMLRLEIPADLAGTSVSSLGEPGKAMVVAVDRMGGCVIPTGDVTFQQGDVAHVIVRRDALDALRARLKETREDH
jgi:Trk K+ transport system NAD-binding subunit